jgi:hypothetical protein
MDLRALNSSLRFHLQVVPRCCAIYVAHVGVCAKLMSIVAETLMKMKKP